MLVVSAFFASRSRSKSGAGAADALAVLSMSESTSGFAAAGALAVSVEVPPPAPAYRGLFGSICAPMAAAFCHSGWVSPTAPLSSLATVSKAVALLRAW